jgi:RNA polymerase sigma factor (sigma-70 family)
MICRARTRRASAYEDGDARRQAEGEDGRGERHLFASQPAQRCSFQTAGRGLRCLAGRPSGADSQESPNRFGPMREYRAMARTFAHLSDEAVVALVARSDEEALAELYDRFGRVAYGLALRVLRDEKLAEDAVQEGFLAAWRNADRFMPERAKASTWILTFVHRRAVDLVRREDRRRAEPLTEGVEPASGGSAEDDAWLRFERERVQAALRQLPDQQREALELAYYGGFSQSELAERLGQPVGTIKSRMFTGLARLRELLAEPGNGETAWKPTPSTT